MYKHIDIQMYKITIKNVIVLVQGQIKASKLSFVYQTLSLFRCIVKWLSVRVQPRRGRMLIACRFFLRHNVHRRCLSENLTIVPIQENNHVFFYTCILGQFAYVATSSMSNDRGNYIVGKNHLEILKCQFIIVFTVSIVGLMSIDVRSFQRLCDCRKEGETSNLD